MPPAFKPASSLTCVGSKCQTRSKQLHSEPSKQPWSLSLELAYQIRFASGVPPFEADDHSVERVVWVGRGQDEADICAKVKITVGLHAKSKVKMLEVALEDG